MIILDTDVLSEPMRPNGDPAVAHWLDRQRPETLYLTTISLAEPMLCLEILPLGLRRSRLEVRIGEVVQTFGDHRTLFFDARAARAFAVSVARAHPQVTRSALLMARSRPLPPPMDLPWQHGMSPHSPPRVSP